MHLRGASRCPPSMLSNSTIMRATQESVKVSVAQPCPTLCNPMDRSPPGSSVHGLLQVRMLEWVAISFSRASSWPRDGISWPGDAGTAGRLFTIWATREAQTQVVYNFLVAMLRKKIKRNVKLTLIMFYSTYYIRNVTVLTWDQY